MKRRHFVSSTLGLGAALAGGWTARQCQASSADSLASAGAGSGAAAGATASPALGPGGLPEAFWALKPARPQGGELHMDSLRQSRPLLVNFWATWCPPCVKEMPMLDAFARRHQQRGLRVLGLAVDSPSAVRGFLQKHPVGFDIGLVGLEGTDVLKAMGHRGAQLPYTLWLPPQGPTERIKGALTQAHLDDWAARWTSGT
jgi:thiol-disulfide isomerase/thioredoxin